MFSNLQKVQQGLFSSPQRTPVVCKSGPPQTDPTSVYPGQLPQQLKGLESLLKKSAPACGRPQAAISLQAMSQLLSGKHIRSEHVLQDAIGLFKPGLSAPCCLLARLSFNGIASFHSRPWCPALDTHATAQLFQINCVECRQGAYPQSQPQQASSFAYPVRPSVPGADSAGPSHQMSLSHQQAAMVGLAIFPGCLSRRLVPFLLQLA